MAIGYMIGFRAIFLKGTFAEHLKRSIMRILLQKKMSFIYHTFLLEVNCGEQTAGDYCNKDSLECSNKEYIETPIYPDLIGREQNDPFLIEAIRTHVLIPPSPKNKPLNVSQTSLHHRNIYGMTMKTFYQWNFNVICQKLQSFIPKVNSSK